MRKQNLSTTITMIIVVLFITIPIFADVPFWPNIKVNDNEEPSSEEETSIAAHGNYIVAGYHFVIEDDATSITRCKCAVSYSHDGGKTWNSNLMPLPGSFTDACDPCVAVADDGTFYYAQLGLNLGAYGINQVYISRSDDHGVTWTTPADVDNGDLDSQGQDKEWIAVQGDNVYISFYSSGDIIFVRSTDRCVSFETYEQLNDSGTCNLSTPIFDGSNVYVFWKNFSEDKIYMARSSDQGASFEATDIFVRDVTSTTGSPPFRTGAQTPVVAVNPTNHHIYCVWMDGMETGDPSNIYFIISSDSGDSWSAPVKVNDDAVGNGQWFPWIDIDETGICHIVWYDDRNNTGGTGDYLDLYYATYDESTNTFSANMRVTDQTFEVVLPPESGIASFIGDYIGVSHSGYAHALWMDSRGGTQDVFTSNYTETLPQKVQVMMVTDVSSSMSWDSSIPGIPKIDPVKEDTELILDLIRDGTGGDPQDKLGMAQFGSSLRNFTDNDAPFLPSVTHVPLTPVTTSFREDCRDYIEDMEGSGGTSIASGLQKAIEEFSAHPDANAQNMVILLSDGHETSNPRVDQDLINDLRSENARCFTLGYGTDPYIDEPLLFDIAAQTGGIYHYADSDSPAVIQDLYVKILASVLDGDTIVDPIHTLTAGSSPAKEIAKITEADNIAYFILGWTHPELSRRMCLKLKTPGPRPKTIHEGNVDLYPNIEYISGNTYICYKVRFPLIGILSGHGPGEWTMSASMTGTGGDPEEVNLVSFVQSDLKMSANFQKYTYGSGDPITIRAKLKQKGTPITGANVFMDGTLPLKSLGNVLSLSRLTRSQQSYMKGLLKKKKDLSLKAAKLKTLLETSKEDLFPRKIEKGLRLYDDGLHDDLAANDGIYADTFKWTETPGTYSFLVTAECTSLGGHKAIRQRHASLYEKVAVDGMESIATVDYYDYSDLSKGKRAYRATVTPKDRFRNYLGPGFPHLINFKATMGQFKPVEDHNDGTYSAVLIADENRMVRITPTVDGITMETEPVASPPGRTLAGRPMLSFHVGRVSPLGTFGTFYKSGFSLATDLEWPLSNRFSFRGMVGYNMFKSKIQLIGNTYIININADLRYYFPLSSILFFAEAGPGYYILEATTNKFGLTLGGGIRYGISPAVNLEFITQYHTIFTAPDNTDFLNYSLGIAIRL
jgi:hypothetical protein